MKERLVLVESFSELRAGMIVVVKECDCGRDWCRAMLIELVPPNDVAETYLWSTAPDCSCEFDTEYEWGIHPSTVASGKLFRVDDGLEASSQTTTRRRHPKTEAAR